MKLTDFFIYCSGGSPELLQRCPTERSKYTGIGGAIFFTGAFAALAAGYALYTVFDNVFLAIGFGLFWGAMIFNLDRYIISSMRKERTRGKEFLTAIPRVILAIIISIVISKPLELRIFQKEIAPELAVMEQQAYAREEAEVVNRFTLKSSQLKNELTAIESVILNIRARRDDLMREAQSEADGTGGSRKKNLGPIYKIKKADADRADNELREMLNNSTPLIKDIQKRTASNDSARSAALRSLEFSKRDGPAARMEALERISAKSPAIRLASWFILLLIIAIEISPVFIKIMTAKGPYDHLLAVEEHRFNTDAIGENGEASAAMRQRVQQWPADEKQFGNDRLNSALKKL